MILLRTSSGHILITGTIMTLLHIDMAKVISLVGWLKLVMPVCVVWRPYGDALVDRRYGRNLIQMSAGEFALRLRNQQFASAAETALSILFLSQDRGPLTSRR